MRRLVRSLADNDRLAFVTFDSNVKTVLPFTVMNEAGKDKARKLVGNLKDGSSTNLCGGLVTGMKLLQQDGVNEVNAVLLFTDGEANVGISDSAGILREAKKVVGSTKPPEQWANGEVLQWLQSVGLGMYKNEFQKNCVDGKMLVMDITDELLLNDLNVKKLHLEKFKREIGNLHQEGKQNVPIQVHAFGYGASHNVQLLESIANTFDGMYYYMKDEETIKGGFANCLGGLLSVVAQDIKVCIEPVNGVSDLIVLGQDHVKVCKNQQIVSFADLQSEEKRHVLCSFTLPPIKANDLDFQCYSVSVQYKNMVQKGQSKCQFICSLKRGGKIGESNLDIDLSNNRIMAAEALTQAESLGDQNKLEQGREVVRAAIKKLEASFSAKDSQTEGLIKDLNNALESLRDRHQYIEVGKKYMKQNQMCWAQERAANFDSLNYETQAIYNTSAKAEALDMFERQDSLDSVEFNVGDQLDNISSGSEEIFPIQQVQSNVFFKK